MRWWSRAPAVAAGAFALSLAVAHAADPLALARQLFDDDCWEECRRECERVMAASPGHTGASALKSDASERMAAASRTASSTASWPGRALVWLYRAAIRPAIGARCSLDPSCSEYFLQSSRAHGLLGFTLAADRLVREPSVVHAHADPVAPGGKRGIPDPLGDHDFWMRRSRFRTGPRRRRGKGANRGRGTLAVRRRKDRVHGNSKAMRMIPLLLGAVLGLAPDPARGGDAAAADPALRLAIELVARGDAAGAAVEFRRLALAASDPVARGGFEWAAAREHARDGRIDNSERMLDRAEDSGAPKAPCLLLRAENAQTEGDFNSASFFWSAFREATDEPDARAYAARKFAAAMIRDQRPDDAIQALGFSPRDESAAIAAVEAWRAAPRKSPRLGGLLGLVPGLGYAYSGEYANGVRSLILNGLFLSLMALSAEDDNWGAFGLAAFFEITWYSGSIYGGVDAAHRWNLRNTMTAVRQLEGDAAWEADDRALPVIDLRFSF